MQEQQQLLLEQRELQGGKFPPSSTVSAGAATMARPDAVVAESSATGSAAAGLSGVRGGTAVSAIATPREGVVTPGQFGGSSLSSTRGGGAQSSAAAEFGSSDSKHGGDERGGWGAAAGSGGSGREGAAAGVTSTDAAGSLSSRSGGLASMLGGLPPLSATRRVVRAACRRVVY